MNDYNNLDPRKIIMAGGVIAIFVIIFLFLPLILWMKQMVRLAKKGKMGSFWAVFLLGIIGTLIGLPLLGSGLFFGPLFAGLIGLCLGRGENNFQCQFCFFKYKSDMLGGESPGGGRICLSCLRDKQIGRTQ